MSLYLGAMATISAREFRTKRGGVFVVRTAEAADAAAVLGLSRSVMEEQVFTLSKPEELSFTVKQEAGWIQGMKDAPS